MNIFSHFLLFFELVGKNTKKYNTLSRYPFFFLKIVKFCYNRALKKE